MDDRALNQILLSLDRLTDAVVKITDQIRILNKIQSENLPITQKQSYHHEVNRTKEPFKNS